MQRRDFLTNSLAAGAGTLLSGASATGEAADDALDVALIGAGIQGRVLAHCLLAIGGVRIRAVCDVWSYRRTAALHYLQSYGQEADGYEDYREMLQKVKGLRAAVVASPDFVHAEQTVACLDAGLHVYCEAPMAPALAQAQAMAGAARRSGRLLQVGYQRRSCPRYRHIAENLLGQAGLIADITAAHTQWNQSELWELGWPRRHAIPEADLERYGYAGMREFRNWRWFRRCSAGPFAGAAVHQVDVLNRMLGVAPRAVLAAGGADYYEDRECHDHITAIYEYPVGERTIRATCQVHTTTRGTAGSHELLVGTDGSIRMSDRARWVKVFREPTAEKWDEWIRKGYLKKTAGKPAAVEEPSGTSDSKPVQETGEVEEYEMTAAPDKPSFQYHLENFLGAIRGKGALNCPPEVALPAEAAVLRAIDAVAAERRLAIGAIDGGDAGRP